MGPSLSNLYDRLGHADNGAAWEEFVRVVTTRVLDWARQARLQAADAADVLQEVLVTVVEQRPTLERDRTKSITRWLYTVTLNNIRNRRKAKAPVLDPDAVNRATTPDPTEVAAQKECRRQVLERILKLAQKDFSETTLKAWTQSVLEDRVAADVAADLGMTVQAVYAATHHVKARLRQKFPKAQD